MAFNKVSVHGLKALLSVMIDGSGDLEEDAAAPTANRVKAMLLDETSTLDENWEDITVLTDSSSLQEYTTLGPVYHRRTLASITLKAVADVLQFSAADITWSALVSALSGNDIGFILIYMELDPVSDSDASGGLDARIPICLLDLAFTPDGTDVIVSAPTTGFFTIPTDGC